eukprot:gene10001-13456_t
MSSKIKNKIDITRYFDPLAVVLDDTFPGQLNIIGLKDPRTTGNFEVTIVPINKLIHSKTSRGQGKCQTDSEIQAVIEQIAEYLDSLNETSTVDKADVTDSVAPDGKL